MNQTVVGMFNSRSEAESALSQLIDSGFAASAIDIKSADAGTSGTSGTSTSTGTGTTRVASEADQDKGVMASIGDFFGNMFGSDDDREYADHYAEGVRRGGAVLTLDIDEARVDMASDVMERCGAVDVEERVAAWRQSGYEGFDRGAAPYDGKQAAAERDSVVPVIQEELDIGKRKVSGGTVRVVSRVTSKPVHESVDLVSEKAVIERRPVDREATEAELSGFEDRTIEVQESAEKAVVGKSAHVVEEVVVGKQTTHETQQIDETVRRTDVEVERSDAGAMNDESDAAYRSHHAANHAADGGYEGFEPAYRRGAALRTDARYSGQDWDAVEPHARQDWESKNPDTWDRMKGAVKHGWDRATR